ncbi:MAG: N-acetylmuramoyl-L-alanine amidase [Intestinibacter sp.]
MSYKVSIDAGHSNITGGKRTPKLKKDLVIDGKVVKKKGVSIHEFEFNILVAKSLKKALERCGVQVKIVNDETGKTDTPLSTRASRANAYGSNLHISCHYNAIGSCASFQTRCHGLLVLKTKGCQSKSSKLADCVHNAIKGNYSHTYGVGIDTKWSGFTLAILRQTKMPAILIEYGFMDYEEEAMKMLNPDWYVKLAEDTCKGICNYLGITYKKSSSEQKEEGVNGSIPEKKNVKDFIVRIKADSLNVRKGPGTKFDQVIEDGKKLVVKKGGAYTITHTNESETWGYLKSGAGWICITSDYVEKV